MISDLEIIIRLLIAALLGSIIGLEREKLVGTAGLRTHMLVCVGSCLMMIVSAFSFADILGTHNVVLDPSRIAAQVVSGIGFLGAGVILLRGEIIRGLTTAASIWVVAGVGLAVGGGLYLVAVAATIIILIILAGIKPLEKYLNGRKNSYIIRLTAKRNHISINMLQQRIGNRVDFVKQLVVLPIESSKQDNVTIVLSPIYHEVVLEIIEELKKLPFVSHVEEEKI